MKQKPSQSTIWVVDDLPDIIFSFTEALSEHVHFRFVYAASAREVNAVPGDIVFLDLNGTGADLLQVPEGVSVIRMTGGLKPADLYKPFTNEVIHKLVSTIEKGIPFQSAAVDKNKKAV